MDSTAIIIGPRDGELERLVASCGIKVCTRTDPDALRRETKPDLILVDARGSTALPAWLSDLKRLQPSADVMIVATALEPQMVLEAMRAGASECLVEPLSQSSLQAAVGRLLERRAIVTAGRVFAFLGTRGGVGTTTAAVNVAIELARAAPGRTLLVDLNMVCGDAAVFLGLKPHFSILDAFEKPDRLDQAYLRSLVVRAEPGLDLLPSSDQAVPPPLSVESNRLREVIALATKCYDYVVLDIPRTDPVALSALELADEVVLVADQELSAVRMASRMASTLKARYGRAHVRIVLNRYDPRAEISQEDVERVVGEKVDMFLPSAWWLAQHALNAGRPLALSNHSRLAGSFKTLAENLAGRQAGQSETQPRHHGSLLGLFGGRSNDERRA